VQIADAPGRHEPGTGTIPLQAQLDALEAAGYTGWVSLEYRPESSTMDGLEWLPAERRGTTGGTA
jgi:hydroxypyruvate isomerase